MELLCCIFVVPVMLVGAVIALAVLVFKKKPLPVVAPTAVPPAEVPPSVSLRASEGELGLRVRQVNGQWRFIPPHLLRTMESFAPLVGQRLQEVQRLDWGWLGQNLTRMAPEEVILYAQPCTHGRAFPGVLVAGLDSMWWLGTSGQLVVREQELSYAWMVEVSRSPAVVTIGNDQFQMQYQEVDYISTLIRSVQELRRHR